MSARSERWFVAAAFVAYAAVTLWVAVHHEPWRDEADPWLLIRDGGVTTMLARTGWVGMPALWYLAIAPLVKLGLPYASMTLLNLAFAWAAALVFLIAAPFSRLIRVAFVFSYFMAFEYAAIARPYALALMLLFTALAAWKRRPMLFAVAVALLANTTPHMLLFAAILGALFLRNSRAKLPIAVMLLGGLLCFVQLLPPKDAPANHVIRGASTLPLRTAIRAAFLPRVHLRGMSLAGVAFVAFAAYAIANRTDALIFLVASTAGLSLLFAFVWMGGPRHAGLMLVALVAALWLARVEGPLRFESAVMTLLALSLGVSCVVAVRAWRAEIARPFSGSREMARYLVRNGLASRPIAAHRAVTGAAVLPYLEPRTLYYPAMQRSGSYLLWDGAQARARGIDMRTAAAMARAHYGSEPFFFLANGPLDAQDFRLLHATAQPFGYKDEQFFLYEALPR